MKKDTHPTYYKDTKVTCACGNTFNTGSTMQEIRTEICAECHPFYTGKQNLIDTAGRVDRFKAMQKKTKEAKEKTRATKAAKSTTKKNAPEPLSNKEKLETIKKDLPKK
ncbi:MAG: 50S ribosomal protein L31 [Parcubacteria group bacterium CG_4_9_14_0_2_um_filter_41_8]|nr:MAG: 50S ribosomal protein L31 [Parcubacteria group bacterium CG1_02_41_12]PIP66793.1 MAG: 50S ribosomal protein L31 [Parcubacteria group bacterium CG22_combo_CG10-13_8_21_14_all_41_9]PIQ79150.1 MAG: 50S ribosomal protein L31 [Parcubacteria group bacterium CG11_big_fil_rev_8_21_14_0_20_41_14]PIR56769.1 MAG: 50S ribosomal protein L31 [Parcubacteria group bacterium CG10_big_fil_rev_8_21_14_0_10_41_35]PIZ81290.1 MAG: 50S ribosomal protein L31 [Parcubacteria group bacterium CG_4_10_14_0_2_um_fil